MCTKFRYKLFLKEAIQPVIVESELSLPQILHTLNTNEFILFSLQIPLLVLLMHRIL